MTFSSSVETDSAARSIRRFCFSLFGKSFFIAVFFYKKNVQKFKSWYDVIFQTLSCSFILLIVLIKKKKPLKKGFIKKIKTLKSDKKEFGRDSLPKKIIYIFFLTKI